MLFLVQLYWLQSDMNLNLTKVKNVLMLDYQKYLIFWIIILGVVLTVFFYNYGYPL